MPGGGRQQAAGEAQPRPSVRDWLPNGSMWVTSVQTAKQCTPQQTQSWTEMVEEWKRVWEDNATRNQTQVRTPLARIICSVSKLADRLQGR